MGRRKASWALIGAVCTLICCAAGVHFGLWSHLISPLSSSQHEDSLDPRDQQTASPESIPVVQTPKFLEGVIPKDLNGFAMQDVDGPRGQYKLVVWSEAKFSDQHSIAGWRSKIELFAIEPDQRSATEIWQSDEEELYEPRISVVPEWKCHGQQVFLIRRQAGAAAELVDPVWVENGVVHKLPQVLADYFEIKPQSGRAVQKTQLIGYSRYPESVEVPKFYVWNGEGFIVNESKLQNSSKFRSG